MTPPPNSSNDDQALAKKRTRVTPSQLNILEKTFAVSATPDSKMRKQLAQELQMPERSIQIWFQNRRAKVKMMQKRAKLREEQEVARVRFFAEATAAHHGSHPQPYWYPNFPMPPRHTQLAAKLPIQRAWSTDLIHQSMPPPQQSSSAHHPSAMQMYPFPVKDTDFLRGTISPSPTPHAFDDMRFRRTDSEPVHIIPNTDFLGPESLTPELTSSSSSLLLSGNITADYVTIGSWHRMKISAEDLLCHYNLSDRTFAWHIRDSNYHFKMVVAFDSASSIELTPLDDGVSAQVDLDLAEPPLFFMENADKSWVQCSDFTEESQATCKLQHTIRGPVLNLKQELLNIASADQYLSQITRFSIQGTTTTAAATATATLPHPPAPQPFDHSLLMPQSWRQQSAPVTNEYWQYHSQY